MYSDRAGAGQIDPPRFRSGILQAVAQRLGYKDRFLGGACGCIRPHPDAIDASPTSGSEELRQVPDCLGRHRVVMRYRLANDLADLRVLGFGRVRLRFPVSKLAGIASKAQNASWGECFELGNQSTSCTEKNWDRELLTS